MLGRTMLTLRHLLSVSGPTPLRSAAAASAWRSTREGRSYGGCPACTPSISCASTHGRPPAAPALSAATASAREYEHARPMTDWWEAPALPMPSCAVLACASEGAMLGTCSQAYRAYTYNFEQVASCCGAAVPSTCAGLPSAMDVPR
jgi:hypothetical protein